MARVWGLRSVGVRAARRLALGVDAETRRWRALDDRRGRVVREIYGAGGSLVRVVHSVGGRSDQFDVWVDGSLFRTCGPRGLPVWLRGF